MKSEQPILLSLTFAVFLAAKLFGAIDWSWWIITAPIWVYPVATFGVAFVVAFVKAFKARRKMFDHRAGRTGKHTN